MKLRLVLKTTTKKNKEVAIKFNIAPSQHIGFINFVNLCINQDNPVKIYFEKVSKSGEKEDSKVSGEFKFSATDKNEMNELQEQVKREEKKK
ncbi:MAG: hypothetical protein GF311_08130 [Candidatus Lokiarchaeota archaeon]|jgi:hypothetical protein|nr:hypothetical protein [Candidatus Lokiarchaeota archaeon]